ncbi:AmmeMemoRadiSam system protein B [Amphritea sp. 2_MG-2023]|uniref:AmmeMemoRadiSam system protein B n=1 Tax=Amphritea TaxID=515417 RepID=UPI001C078557|nr:MULTISPECIES: AmmeMemoRadiSam system protein B [Amphritea]MBU2964501.1 AmmeMemoRadiSam system protein B [Amphritea atlantica]MDO6417829.1 AmmeMemoRadiSam system protein B [Amphritea sp. 2_MG-2023]
MKIKQAAVAGMFYPQQPDELTRLVSQLLADNPQSGAKPVAIQVPHAGLIYSGGIAAKAYNRIRPYLADYRRVVLLGPAHRVPLQGMAVMSADRWQTPLGEVEIDTLLSQTLQQEGLVSVNDLAHAQEHCLEVQLPFLQLMQSDLPVLPVLVGETPVGAVESLITSVLAETQTLLLVSSDLSHFHSYEQAKQIDQATLTSIDQLSSDIQPQQACGCYALNGLLAYAVKTGLEAELLGYCNSGDTAGDHQRVVGYCAYAFC